MPWEKRKGRAVSADHDESIAAALRARILRGPVPRARTKRQRHRLTARCAEEIIKTRPDGIAHRPVQRRRSAGYTGHGAKGVVVRSRNSFSFFPRDDGGGEDSEDDDDGDVLRHAILKILCDAAGGAALLAPPRLGLFLTTTFSLFLLLEPAVIVVFLVIVVSGGVLTAESISAAAVAATDADSCDVLALAPASAFLPFRGVVVGAPSAFDVLLKSKNSEDAKEFRNAMKAADTE